VYRYTRASGVCSTCPCCHQAPSCAPAAPSSCVQNASRVQRQQQHKNKDIQRHLARARIAPPASQSVRSRQRVASHDARFAERMIPSVDIISSLAIDCMLEEMSKSNHSAALSPPCSPARLFPDGRSNRPGPLFFTPSRQGCMRSRAPTRFWFWDVTRTGKAHAIRSLNIAHPQLVFFASSFLLLLKSWILLPHIPSFLVPCSCFAGLLTHT